MSTALKKCGKVMFFVDMWLDAVKIVFERRKKMIILG